MKDEKFQLTPDEVANLDPFGARTKDTSSELSSILDGFSKKENEQIFSTEEIIENEKNAWSKILGVDIEVSNPPSYINQEILNNFDKFKLGLRYIPQISIDYKKLREDVDLYFFTNLRHKYPNWMKPEYLIPSELQNPQETRNIYEAFWKQIDESSLTPLSRGKWVAVELTKKPNYTYSDPTDFPLDTNFGFYNRSGKSWEIARKRMLTTYDNKDNNEILKLLGLPIKNKNSFRFPYAIEYNLLANREGWGENDATEWVEDRVLLDDKDTDMRFYMGDQKSGGAGAIHMANKGVSRLTNGFRILIDLP